MAITIRLFCAGDADIVSMIYRDSVERLGSQYYTPEQVAAWTTLTPDPQRLIDQMNDGRLRLVAIDENKQIRGFADRDFGSGGYGHVDYFYVHPDAARTGIGRELYQAVETAAINAGMTIIDAEASEAAKAFFMRLGFEERQRRNLNLGGVAIHNYAMRKKLTR